MSQGVNTVTVSQEAYTVVQELVLEPAMHRLPVNEQLVESAGFTVMPPPEELLLAQVVFAGGSYGGNWQVNALVGNTHVGSIWCAPGTPRAEVLQVVDTWVRASKHTSFVPGVVHEVPVSDEEAPYFVYGVALVRGDRL
jgi:hypothetical protein